MSCFDPNDLLEVRRTHADWRLQMTDTISIRAGWISGDWPLTDEPTTQNLAAKGAREIEALIGEWIEANPEKATALAGVLRSRGGK